VFDKCPGVSSLIRPTLSIKKCPQCGDDVEIVSTDMQTVCSKCGFTIYNNVASCVQWCQYARECVGEETYQRLKKDDPSKIEEAR
jgi:ribosomal protein S27AE